MKNLILSQFYKNKTHAYKTNLLKTGSTDSTSTKSTPSFTLPTPAMRITGVASLSSSEQLASLWPDFSSFSLLAELDSASNIRYGLLFIMALSSLTVYSIILAGWASNSKYAFIGALRSAAQMISYEVSITLILLPVILLSGSLNLASIAMSQAITVWYVFPLLPVAMIFLVAMLAETNRTPFDLPEAEAELVAGYNVDYSSLPFAMFFLGEYSNMILMSVLFCLLFLGGWTFGTAGSAFILVFKAAFVWFFFVLVRASLPRYRYDQLMDIGWKSFLPLASGYLFFVIGLVVFTQTAPVVQEVWESGYTQPSLVIASLFGLSISKDKTPMSVRNRREVAPLVSIAAVFNPTYVGIFSYEVGTSEHFITDYSTSAVSILPSWLLVTFFLFFTGLLGMVYNYRNFLITMLSVEVMYLGNVTSFVIYGVTYQDKNALIYALLVLIFAACESAVGLGVLIVLYRFGNSVAFDSYTTMHSSGKLLAVLALANTVSTEANVPFFSRTLMPLMRNQYAQGYFGVALYLFLATALCALLATLAYLLSLSTSQDTEKRSEYECGFAPFDSATRLPFDVHFYLVGILFLIFDVEVALLFPWTLSLEVISWYAFYQMVGFILVLTVGFIYEWKRGALIWPSRQRTHINNSKNSGFFLTAFLAINASVDALEFASHSTRGALHLVSTLALDSSLFMLLLVLLLVAAYSFGKSHAMSQMTQNIFEAALGGLSLLAVLTALTDLSSIQESQELLFGYLYTSYYVNCMKFVVLVCALFILYASSQFVLSALRPLLEFPLMLVFALLFMLILVSSNHLLAAFLALSGFSLNMYVLILFDAPSHSSREAGIKYYYLSTLSTGFILYGIFLLYVLSSSGNFNLMDINLSVYAAGTHPTMLSLGVLLTFVGFMFKLSAFPGHLWAPDVYEGSPAPVTAYFMLPVKIAVLAFFMRYVTTALGQLSSLWTSWLAIACIGSIVWGAFTALYARNTRRFLAYTSINQMGFLLIGLVCNSVFGYRATIFYLFVYALMSIAFLLIFIQARREDGRPLLYLVDFRGFGQSSWLHAWAVVSAMFSMAGIPPLAGFFGKYYLLLQALEDGLFLIVIVALATSLVSTYYYLRLIKIMWFEGAEAMTAASCHMSTASLVILFITEALLWLFALLAPTLLNECDTLAESLLRLLPQGTLHTNV